MRFTWTCAVKDLRRLWRDPVALAVWIGIPLLVTVLMYVVFGTGTVLPRGQLLVADEDGTLLSSLVASAFSQGELGKMLVVEKVSSAQGRARIQRGDGSALLVIPKGFGGAFLAGRPAQLKLIKNPAQRILPEIIEEVASMLADAGSYLQAYAGDQLKLFAQGPPKGATTFPDETIIATSLAFNRLGAGLAKYLQPPAIGLTSEVIEEKKPAQASFAVAMYPGMLFMTILFLVLGLSSDVWKEREQGTLRRLGGTPARLWAFLAGKVAAVAVVFVVLGVLSLALAHGLLKMEVANPWLAVLWMTLSGVALLLMMMLLQLLSTGQRAAQLLAFLIVFPLAMLGGSFMPFEVMPDWLAAIGRHTPNGFATMQLKLILAGQVQPEPLAVAFAGALLAVAVMFPLALWRLRRAFVA